MGDVDTYPLGKSKVIFLLFCTSYPLKHNVNVDTVTDITQSVASNIVVKLLFALHERC